MTTLDLATVDHLLTTTRSVRKRLDLGAPVEPEVIEECLRLAIQAPTGGNSQGWRWIVVTDADERAALAELYREIAAPYIAAGSAAGEPTPARSRQRVVDSATYLADHLHEVPVHVIPCIYGELEGAAELRRRPGRFGSIFPRCGASSSRCAAAGSARCSRRCTSRTPTAAAELLGIPDGRDPGRADPGRVLHRRRLQARGAPPGRGDHLLERLEAAPLISRADQTQDVRVAVGAQRDGRSLPGCRRTSIEQRVGVACSSRARGGRRESAR